MLRDDMNELISKLAKSLLIIDEAIQNTLDSNRKLIQEIDLENEKSRQEIVDMIHSSSEPIIQLMCKLQDIEMGTPDARKVVKHIIQKPLSELGDEEYFIMKFAIKNIDAKPMLASENEQIAKLGRVINYLKGTDLHKQRTLKKIADTFSLMNLYHDAKHHETQTPPTPRPRSGSVDKGRSLLRNSASALSRSISSLRLSSPRTKDIASIFEKEAPELYAQLEDIKLGKSPAPSKK